MQAESSKTAHYVVGLAALASVGALAYSIHNVQTKRAEQETLKSQLIKQAAARRAVDSQPSVITLYFNDRDELIEEYIYKNSKRKHKYSKVTVCVGKES